MSQVSSLISPLLFLLLISFPCSGQQTNFLREHQLEELAERMSSSEDASSESSLLLDDLTRYANRPLCINTATEEELMRMNLLNFSQVQSLLGYRKEYGNILTANELVFLEGFDEGLLNKILPFISFSAVPDSVEHVKMNSFQQSWLGRVKTTFPVAEGYSSVDGKPAAYSGGPYSFLTRYRAEVGQRLEFGLTGENDAGEEFFRNSNKNCFDFLSGFVAWNGKGFLRKIVAGDYHLRFGQGVNLWSGGGVGYASDIFSLMRSGEGIRPYSSTDENLFFRGTAVKLALKPLQVSLFFSDHNRDGNLESDLPGKNFITSFRTDGLHRTLSELTDERNVGERLVGGYGDLRFEKLRIGFLGSFRQFEFPVVKGDLPYKSKSFEGNTSCNYGMDYQLIFNRISLFGEGGWTGDFKPAFLNGIIWKAHPRFALSMLHRYYDPFFQSFSSASFAEGSGVRNERGFFAACEFNPLPRLKVMAQSDLFYFPWLTYQTFSPSQGYNLSCRVEWTFRPDGMVYLYTKYLQQPSKISGVTGIPEQWEERISKWRIHGDFGLSGRMRLRSRMEFSLYRFSDRQEKGFLVYQDLILSPSRRLKCWMRVSWYRTGGYDTRIYCYENDLLYYYAVPEFHGTGARSYINLKLEPVRSLSVYAKAGYTLRAKQASIGTGYDATPGDHRWDARLQLALKF